MQRRVCKVDATGALSLLQRKRVFVEREQRTTNIYLIAARVLTTGRRMRVTYRLCLPPPMYRHGRLLGCNTFLSHWYQLTFAMNPSFLLVSPLYFLFLLCWRIGSREPASFVVLYEVAAGLNFRSHSSGELITREFPPPSNPKLPLLCAFLGEESIFAKCDAACCAYSFVFSTTAEGYFPLRLSCCCIVCH